MQGLLTGSAGAAAGDLVNGLASDASKQLADKISPDQKNPSDPKNKNDASNQGKGESETNIKKVLPNDTNKQSEQNAKQNYDTTTDINKVVSSITHDVIMGSVGAIAGILAGGGNIGLDAAAGGITSLKVAPKPEKPKDQKKDSKATDTKQPTTGEPNAPTK